MGSHMKKSIFEEQTAKALKKWQKAAKERKRLRNKAAAGADKCSIKSIHGHGSPSPSSSGFLSGENTPSQGASPIHLLHNYKYRSNQQDIESVRSYLSDNELSENEPSTHHHQDRERNEDLHSNDFSFVKL